MAPGPASRGVPSGTSATLVASRGPSSSPASPSGRSSSRAMRRSSRPPATWSDSSEMPSSCRTRWPKRAKVAITPPATRLASRAARRCWAGGWSRVSDRKTGTLPTGSMTTRTVTKAVANRVASSVISGMRASGWGRGERLPGRSRRGAPVGAAGGVRPRTSTCRPGPAFPVPGGPPRPGWLASGAVDFRRTTVAALAADVAARRVSARELTAAAIDLVDRLDPELNAFVAVDADAALAEAAAIDERIAAGQEVGPLAGIPLAVKDLEDACGFVTSHGSAAFASGQPATDDSPLVARLRAAGCVVVGKTNTPELGWKADTENPVFGATRNPWDTERSPGGSSGGSAAAVAGGLVPLATGSDGGGSIRIPSAVTGLTGFKPSLGRVPSGGSSAPDWPLLSTKGPMARTARDLALVLDAVVGPEPTDLASLPLPEASWSRSLDELHPPRAVVWAPTLGYASVDAEVLAVCEAAVRRLEEAGTAV